jgi:hypothetical protein
MFPRIFIVMILFTGQLLSFDQKPEEGSQKKINPMIKNLVISAVVGVGFSVFSSYAVYLVDKPLGKTPYDFEGIIMKRLTNMPLLLIGINFKIIPGLAVNSKKISLKNGQIICGLISGVHGLCAAAVCHYGLNRFFPT